MTIMAHDLVPGSAYPLGATPIAGGVNFSVYANKAEAVELLLFESVDAAPEPNPPVIWDIESDPALAGVKLIAEAWDAAGLYQVGTFVGDAWKEWNGKFRDDVRSFVKSDNGYVAALTQRLTGSPDVYGKDVREPEQSVNFVTVHDARAVAASAGSVLRRQSKPG